MKAQIGTENEFNDFFANEVDEDDVPLETRSEKKARSLAVRRMIEYRLEQKMLKDQIDTWGFEVEGDIDIDH